MKLVSLYEALLLENSKVQMEAHFIACMKKYFPEYYHLISQWGKPKFSIRDMPSKAGLFSYKFVNNSVTDQVIHINKDFMEEPFLKSVMFHETIHYVQANLVARKLSPYVSGKWSTDGHDKYFFDMVSKMNSVEGDNFVSRNHDASQTNPALKDSIYIYGFVDSRYYAYVWSNKPLQNIQNFLEKQSRIYRYKGIFNFTTNDLWYKSPTTKVTDKTTKFKFGIITDADKIEYIKSIMKQV